MKLTEESLRQFMLQSLGVDTHSVAADAALFSSGIIDSFALVSLLTFIEGECGFRVGPDEVTLDNFDSIARMLEYSRQRLSGAR